MLKKVILITDGSTAINPGPGGWACILRYKDKKRDIYGFDPGTTNNRMELTAVIQGLHALKEKCDVEVISDSEYVIKGITRYIWKWKKNGWKTAEKKDVINQDLWKALDKEQNRHIVTFNWVRGHDGHPDNMLCDQLARLACRDQKTNCDYVIPVEKKVEVSRDIELE